MVLPVRYKEILNIQKLGISKELLKPNNVTMDNPNIIIIVDLNSIYMVFTKKKLINKINISIEAAIMNPNLNVLGLRKCKENETQIQIFNIEKQTRIKTCKINEKIKFWKWLNDETIAFVTKNSCYHWEINKSDSPEKQFMHSNSNFQVIDYDTYIENKWLLMYSIEKINEKIVGNLTIYQKNKKKTQTINAHGGCFVRMKLPQKINSSILLCCTKSNENKTKLLIKEIEGESISFTIKVDIDIQSPDFIIKIIPDQKNGMLFILSQYGKLFLYDIISGICIYQQQVSQTKTFISSYSKETGNIYILDYKGQLFSFSVDKNNIIKYVSEHIKNVDLGVQIASRCNVSDDTFHKMFRLAIHDKNYKKAAKIAVEAPNDILRNSETIRILKNITTTQDHLYPDLLYFQLLLDRGVLDHEETINLCKRVISINLEKGLKYIQKYLKEKKITCSEILGDILINYNIKIACSVYLESKIHEKTILCFLRMKNWDNAIDFIKKNDLQVQWPILLKKMHNSKRKDSLSLSLILSREGFISPNECIKIFLDPNKNDIQNCILYLSEFLKNRGDRDEDSILQTKLLELSITETPEITDEMMKSNNLNFTKYDKIYIARISEKAELYQKALEHYEDINDIKRLINIAVDSDKISHTFLITFFGILTSKNGLLCLDDLLKLKQSEKILQLIVQISKVHSNLLGPHKLVQLFEKHDCYSGMYLYLESLVDITEDSQLVFKYIQSCIEVNQIKKVEHLCKNNNIYDPLQVKKFLLEKNMINDPRPLIHVCDRHGFISELTIYLYNNQLYKFIEVYIQKMNPSSTPEVIGSLLDLNIPEDQIRELVNSVSPPQCPIKELVESFENRNRLRLLLQWLEARIHEGEENNELFNAIGKEIL